MADSVSGGALPERLIGERIAGRFVVERLIGHGPLSTAYLAHDERLHRRVTVKLFHPRHRDDVLVVRTQLEISSAVARLSHEHVAMVIDRAVHDEMPVLVLEYVRGENLQERIDRYAPLAVHEVVGYGLQIARALAHAHGHDVMHGNLRPENVLLTEDRDVKLVDFGGGSYVAQLVGDPYAAPELSELDADAQAEPTDDIYALGALLFVALTEEAPMPGIGPGDVQLRRPDVSPRLAGAIALALATDPVERQSSMRAFAAELATVHEAAPRFAPTGADGRFDATQAMTAVTPDMVDEDSSEVDEYADTSIVARSTGRREAPRRAVSPHQSRARILAWSVVVVPLVALVLFGIMLAGEQGSDQVGRDDTSTAGPTEPVAVVGAVSFDPKPKGDGVEHPDDVANAVDGKPASIWETEGYDRPDFNGAKPGVGLVLELERPVEVRDIAITTTLPNWTVEVYVSNAPQRTLEGWRKASKSVPVASDTQIAVDTDGRKASHVLLWITALSIDVDEPDRYRARISDVTILGAAASDPG
ncbi:MAG: serine/threonine protein kinase [Thermoleophilia bacterium]|nr:serine/threonine protein kinase [Thermoleophilia bacterium]